MALYKEKKEWWEAFDKLLAWLDPDRERAGEKYEDIRSTLMKIFVCRGCANAEELADATIDRVISKLPEIVDTYTGNPALYFSKVANYILLEDRRKNPTLPLSRNDPPDEIRGENESIEAEYECLEQCMGHLTPRNRELILHYYREEKQAMIDNRKKLAGRLGIKLNALRVRADRIRAKLEECVKDCLRRKATRM